MSQSYETLGKDVVPLRYTLRFEPSLHTFTYRCYETIEAIAKKSTKRILLNSSGLKIKKVTILCKGTSQEAKVSPDEKKERIILNLGKAVSGQLKIVVSCEGKNDDSMEGFYRSRYTVDNKEKHILTTQFEAANARNAFPCFDEPAFKAKFKISIIVDKKLDCVSNMPIESEKGVGAGRKLVTFKESPLMCTYLVYLGVGNFEYNESTLDNRVKIRVVTVPGKKQYTKLPLDYTKKFLKFYEGYFGMDYCLPKIDVIVIPDFSPAAMENWGAITFRETALLADENSSVLVKQRIAEVIAHELAHQWFGDLVTMEWWNDIWLNESFATFMSYKAMDAVFPEWGMKTQYIDDVVATALTADQLLSTHPIRADVATPAEIDQIFDEISYEKGGSVLNMAENYVGAEIFRKGITHYLKSHEYSNATKDDLWNAVDYAAKKAKKKLEVYNVANEWINKSGYPIITVEKDGNKIALRQERFLLLDKKVDTKPWPIPISYITEKDRSAKGFLMKKKDESLDIGTSRWIKLNYGQNGIYRVAYPDDMHEELGKAIKNKQISGIDAWGIENDMFVLARSGRIKVQQYLDFIDKYCHNAEYPLNSNILGHLGWLFDMLYNKPEMKEVGRVMRGYSKEMLAKLGWTRKADESTIDTVLRESAIAKAALSGDQGTINKAHGMFDSFLKNNVEIDQNLRSAVYRIVAWNEGNKYFELFKKKYLDEPRPEEKMRFLGALGAFRDVAIANEALKFNMSKNVRYQDGYVIPYSIASNPVVRMLVWDWTKKSWPVLKSRYGSGTHMLGRYVSMMSFVSERKRQQEIDSFFKNKSNMRTDIVQSLNKTLERIEVNIKFIKSNSKA